MKKILAFILALTLFALTLTSCEDLLKNLGIDSLDDLDGAIKDVADITEEEWNDLTKDDHFHNFRFTLYVEGIRNIEIEYEGPTCDLRIDGDIAYGNIDGEEDDYLPSDYIPSLKEVYVKTALAMLDNYSDFEYDEATNTYKSTGTITYNTNVSGYNAKIVVDNVTVEFTDELLVSKIDCHMLQYILTDDGEEFVCEVNAQFIYSEYGEVELEPDPDALPPLTGGEIISGTYYSTYGEVITFEGNNMTRSYDGRTVIYNYRVENGTITLRFAESENKVAFSRGDGYVEIGGNRYTSTPPAQTNPGGGTSGSNSQLGGATPSPSVSLEGKYRHSEIEGMIIEIDESFINIIEDGELVERYMYKINGSTLICVVVDADGNVVTDADGNVDEMIINYEIGDGYIVIGKDRYNKLLTANS